MRYTVVALLGLAACGRSSLWTLPDFAAPTNDDASALVDGGTDLHDAAFRACLPGGLSIAKAEPTVLFVLDRSGSMNFAFGSFGSRWLSLAHALSIALPPTDQTVATGALLFPSGNDVSARCSLPTSVSIAPSLGNTTALINLMEATQPGGETPTAGALEEAAGILRVTRAATTARAIVLATDGAPNCNAALDPDTCTCANANANGPCNSATQCLDATRTVSTIASLYAEGLPSYVVGIADTSDTVFVDTLNAMAKAGGRAQTGASTLYYAATSDTELQSALVQISAQVGSCDYLVSAVPTNGSVVLTIDGVVIAFDLTNGWSWSDKSNGQVTLNGAACTAAAASAHLVITAQAVCPEDL